jgi:hypothetical protein
MRILANFSLVTGVRYVSKYSSFATTLGDQCAQRKAGMWRKDCFFTGGITSLRMHIAQYIHVINDVPRLIIIFSSSNKGHTYQDL